MALFTNQATLSYNGNTINSNTVTGNILEVLSVTKTAIADNYTANDDVTYVISITNTGGAPITNVTVSDDLGAYPFGEGTLYPLDYTENSVQYYQNGVLQATITPVGVEPLTFSGITIPANGNAMLIYEARVNEFAPLSAASTITNTVTVNGGGVQTPLVAQETINTLDEPELSITKFLTPQTVTENGSITYTFVIQNTGNTAAVATDNVIISDTFDPVLSDITATYDGEPWPAGNYTYNETTGEFITSAGAIVVPAATYTQDPENGNFIITPGVTTITITGII